MRHPAAAAVLPLLPALLGLPAAAAHAESGPYVSVFAGPNFLPSEDYEFEGDLGAIDPDYELGFTLGGALGYRVNDFFRLEAELGYQSHDLEEGEAEGLAVAIEDLDGDGTILSAMVNAYFDGGFEDLLLTPFVGLGVGVARVSLDGIGGTVSTGPVLPGLPEVTVEVDDVIDDADTVLAGQAIAGLSFDVDEHWTTAFSYRFFAVLDAEFETAGIGGIIDAQSFEADFYSHALRFEVRYRF